MAKDNSDPWAFSPACIAVTKRYSWLLPLGAEVSPEKINAGAQKFFGYVAIMSGMMAVISERAESVDTEFAIEGIQSFFDGPLG
ncbi:hypothetical protein [Sodalis praecaptivus]|uniref:hypothetical protein n=1 Tax=Sodalis praecaptivus TaxID=1239307 RepID=UPI0035E3CB1D